MKKNYYYDYLIGPRVSEKSTYVNSEYGQVVFLVKKGVNKFQIKEAIENIYNVKIASINTLMIKGKQRHYKKTVGNSSDIRKVYVRLQEGYSINFYEN